MENSGGSPAMRGEALSEGSGLEELTQKLAEGRPSTAILTRTSSVGSAIQRPAGGLEERQTSELLELLKNQDPKVRAQTAETLGHRLHQPEVIPALLHVLQQPLEGLPNLDEVLEQRLPAADQAVDELRREFVAKFLQGYLRRMTQVLALNDEQTRALEVHFRETSQQWVNSFSVAVKAVPFNKFQGIELLAKEIDRLLRVMATVLPEDEALRSNIGLLQSASPNTAQRMSDEYEIESLNFSLEGSHQAISEWHAGADIVREAAIRALAKSPGDTRDTIVAVVRTAVLEPSWVPGSQRLEVNSRVAAVELLSTFGTSLAKVLLQGHLAKVQNDPGLAEDQRLVSLLGLNQANAGTEEVTKELSAAEVRAAGAKLAEKLAPWLAAAQERLEGLSQPKPPNDDDIREAMRGIREETPGHSAIGEFVEAAADEAFTTAAIPPEVREAFRVTARLELDNKVTPLLGFSALAVPLNDNGDSAPVNREQLPRYVLEMQEALMRTRALLWEMSRLALIELVDANGASPCIALVASGAPLTEGGIVMVRDQLAMWHARAAERPTAPPTSTLTILGPGLVEAHRGFVNYLLDPETPLAITQRFGIFTYDGALLERLAQQRRVFFAGSFTELTDKLGAQEARVYLNPDEEVGLRDLYDSMPSTIHLANLATFDLSAIYLDLFGIEAPSPEQQAEASWLTVAIERYYQ